MSRQRTRIFLDSGDPEETRQALDALHSLDGQTTNPSLIAKSPAALERKNARKLFTHEELLRLYRSIIEDIATLVPNGSVSVEIYADRTTRSDDMLLQARECNSWIPHAHIKLPTNEQGLIAAQRALSENIRVNMTLVFSQAQAAAVYAATRGAKKGDVFLSPFIGRLDDIGLDGLDLIRNIQTMYEPGDHHVEVLAASIRSRTHLADVLNLSVDIVTAPISVLLEHAGATRSIGKARTTSLAAIPFEQHDLAADWRSFNLQHELTARGIEKFVADWKSLLAGAAT